MKKLHTLTFLLHAHVPFVRQQDANGCVEERWLFEAISETYMPLLTMFERLESDGIPFSIALSLSPLLCQMLADPAIQMRYVEHQDRLIAFGERELIRSKDRADEQSLVQMYLDRAVNDRARFVEYYGSNLLNAFAHWQKKGFVELLTSAATHAFMPFLVDSPESLQAQVELAIHSHRSFFSKNPAGFYLPHLAWFPEAGELLRSYGLSYTVVESHGLLHAKPCPTKGTMAPVQTAGGLTVFGRDYQATRQIFDSEEGFIAHPAFRDFNWDAGYELPLEALVPLLEIENIRGSSSFKYRAKGTKGADAQIYSVDAALQEIDGQVDAFLNSCLAQMAAYEAELDTVSNIFCAFDAELFGHRWYEGIHFLERVFRKVYRSQDIRLIKPIHAIELFAEKEAVDIHPSSCGRCGYNENWLDVSNDWTWRHIIQCAKRLTDLTKRFPDETGLKERTLNQATREVLLAQSADWQDLMRERIAPDFAKRRFESFIQNFITAYESLGSNYVSTDWLTKLERRDNIFDSINYRVFSEKT